MIRIHNVTMFKALSDLSRDVGALNVVLSVTDWKHRDLFTHPQPSTIDRSD